MVSLYLQQDEAGAQRSAPQEFDIGSLDEGDKMVGHHKTMVVDVDTPQEAPTPPPALPWRRSGCPAGHVLLAPTPSGSPAGLAEAPTPPPELLAGPAEAPIPPPGNNAPNLYESAPQWFSIALYDAVQLAVAHSMQTVAIPLMEQTVCAALKRSREESSSQWNAYKKKSYGGGSWNSPPASSSHSSSWRGDTCARCHNHFTDVEISEWRTAWNTSLEQPNVWKFEPHNWYNSACAILYTQSQSCNPNYDSSTLSLVQSKIEETLYDPEKSWDEHRFLLLWKTSKLVTLGCYYCRKMSTLYYASLEPRDGRRLHKYFDQHLGGGIWLLT